MNRYLCIHGHFYQPPRENPWLEAIEVQDSAYPYHDWNKRITTECYAPNAASRILDHERKIIDIVNNYSRISFNFGPTLLSWMQDHEPETYRAILDADRESMKRFSGHGSAIAQCYNHMIMPLATARDKRTQVWWGIRDFEHRFGRKPEGMWLPETAVDLETLDIMAEHGIRFTILAQRQAKRVRAIGEEEWRDAGENSVDPKSPYACRLPSGRTIILFFYDGIMSQESAFGPLLDNGENFAERLTGAFSEGDAAQIQHIATDGETYGHHHHFGDMALAYCLYHVEKNDLARITVYGEFLEHNPPSMEAEIWENSSWSCVHGVERWRSDCGCNSGGHPGWTQAWRGPLRAAMDWLRDNLSRIYEETMPRFLPDCWKARVEYIDLVLDRSPKSLERFFSRFSSGLSREEQTTALKLLEMQRNAMLMYTSCGWFFDEISGIETVQVLQYAARAMQLALEVSGAVLDQTFTGMLEEAPGNLEEYGNVAITYEKLVKPSMLDLVRIGAHYAVSSLFKEYEDEAEIYCFHVSRKLYAQSGLGKQRLAIGLIDIESNITHEKDEISFAVLHLGDHNIFGGVRRFTDQEGYKLMLLEIEEHFGSSDVPGTIQLIEKHFASVNYSLWHLFRDEQRNVLSQILDSSIHEIEKSLRSLNEPNLPLIQVMRQMGVPLPNIFSLSLQLMLNSDLQEMLEEEEPDFEKLAREIEQIRGWGIGLDSVTISFIAEQRIEASMEKFLNDPENVSILESLVTLLDVLQPLGLSFELWKSQNRYFDLSKKNYAAMKEKSDHGDAHAGEWLEFFERLGGQLGVRIG
jgi:alpha-amylase/alpha-mannosidase (GH57 family)